MTSTDTPAAGAPDAWVNRTSDARVDAHVKTSDDA